MTWASRFGSRPSGRLWALNASKAMAARGRARSGVPRTLKVPAWYSRSSVLASSWWAAIWAALSITLSHAMAMATPPTDSDRDP